MRNPGKIIFGIIIALALLSIPVWVTQASGNADAVPELTYPTDEIIEEISGSADYGCLDSNTPEYMQVNHKDLLLKYRAYAVRTDAHGDTGDVYWTDANGNEVPFGLNATCLGCHTDRTVFCDQCHDYTATELGCWECHD
ncbi:hypothetical protein ACFLW2_03885 [Chloroflexota bacterium]